MEVMNTIYDADSVAVAGSFIKGLQPGSILFEDLIKNTHYNMAEIQERAEGVFRVLEEGEAGQESNNYFCREGDFSAEQKKFPTEQSELE